jgi:hypothetical protein
MHVETRGGSTDVLELPFYVDGLSCRLSMRSVVLVRSRLQQYIVQSLHFVELEGRRDLRGLMVENVGQIQSVDSQNHTESRVNPSRLFRRC